MLDSILSTYAHLDFVLLDGFDDAVIGVGETVTGLHLVYSLEGIYNILMTEQGMTHDEAMDWYDTNIVYSADGGEGSPIFLEDTLVS